eukprot:5021414-Prorocentrum_lima.AAC.1
MLGVDLGAGRRGKRSGRVLTARLLKGRKKMQRVSRLLHARREARKLIITGVIPTASYGVE